MSETNPTPLPSPNPPAETESMSWLDIWGYALTKPSTATFEEILKDPKANRSPFLWVGLASLLGYIIAALLQSLFGSSTLSAVTEQLGSQVNAGSAFASICCAPISAVFAVLGFAISVGIYHLVAKMFQGEGTYSQLAFAIASFNVPITVVTSVIAAIPYVQFLAFPIGIYAIVLTVLAVKAVHKFGTGKAAAVVLIPVVVLVVIAVVLVVVSIATLLPLIQEGIQGVELPTY